MTQDEIIEMARQANLFGIYADEAIDSVTRFAKLVAQHELEACVKAIEDQIAWDLDDPESTAIKAIRTKAQS